MPGFLLHHTHKPEDCGWAFHDLETSSQLPPGTTFFCTCDGGDHGAYFQVEAATARAALDFLPESMRSSTNVVLGETLVVVGPAKAEQLPAVRLEPAGSGRLSRYVDALRSEVVSRQEAQEEVEELLAKISGVMGRAKASQASPLKSTVQCGSLHVDLAERRVTVLDREVNLTPTEYSLLRQFALNPGKVLTHEVLLQRVWGSEYAGEREYLRVFVRRLRSKIEPDPAHPNFIRTISGVGYRLERGE